MHTHSYQALKMNHVFSQPTATFLIEAINCHQYQTLIIRASMVCVAAPQCVVPDGILTVFNTFPASSVFFQVVEKNWFISFTHVAALPKMTIRCSPECHRQRCIAPRVHVRCDHNTHGPVLRAMLHLRRHSSEMYLALAHRTTPEHPLFIIQTHVRHALVSKDVKRAIVQCHKRAICVALAFPAANCSHERSSLRCAWYIRSVRCPNCRCLVERRRERLVHEVVGRRILRFTAYTTRPNECFHRRNRFRGAFLVDSMPAGPDAVRRLGPI